MMNKIKGLFSCTKIDHFCVSMNQSNRVAANDKRNSNFQNNIQTPAPKKSLCCYVTMLCYCCYVAMSLCYVICLSLLLNMLLLGNKNWNCNKTDKNI
jgi:hypothetical protein